MRFARWVYLLAGIVGVLVVAPMYAKDRFLEGKPLAHPEFYYGFVAVTLAWQLQYALIGTDPLRYRPAMPVAMLAKGGFALSMALLYANDLVGVRWLGAAAFDGFWVLLFLVGYVLTPRRQSE